MRFRFGLSITLCALVPALAEAQPVPAIGKLSPIQVDRILVYDNYRMREEDSRRLAALAYTLQSGQLLVSGRLKKDNFLQTVTPPGIYDEATMAAIAGTKNFDDTIKDIAEKKAAQLDGINFSVPLIGRVADFSIDPVPVSLASSSGLQKAQNNVKVMFPPSKNNPIQIVQRDPRAPNFDREFTTEWVSWAYNEVRQGNSLGKALAPLVVKYQGIDPTKDNSALEVVKSSVDTINKIRGIKSPQEVLKALYNYDDVEKTITNGIQDFRNQLADKQQQAAAAVADSKAVAERVRPVQDVAGSLQLTSYLLSITGNQDAARTVGGLANAAGGVANLMQIAETAGPMVLATGYVGLALAVVSAFQSSQQGPSPFPAIFQMLERISQQIEDLRNDIANGLAALDAHLSGQIAAVNVKVDHLNYNVQVIQKQISDLTAMLQNVNAGLSQQIVELADLIIRGEDRSCFQLTGKGTLLRLTRKDFIVCRDTYLDRATTYAKGTLASTSPASISTAPFEEGRSLFPYAETYEALRKEVVESQSDNRRPLANPAVWYRATTLFMTLVQHSGKHFTDVLADQIDPAIQTGEDILEFINTIAVERSESGGKLRQQRFNEFLDKILALQRDVLSKVKGQIDQGGVQANIPKGAGQSPNYDDPYRMLAKKGLNFCQGIRPTVKAVENISVTQSGGGSGSDESINQAAINAAINRPGGRRDLGFGWGDLRARIEGPIGTFNYSNLSFDNSLLRAIDNPVVLMEQIKYKDAQMNYCISQFTFNRINITKQTQVQTSLDMHVKVYVTTKGEAQNPTVLVQEIGGTRDFVTPFYYYYYDDGARPGPMINNVWKNLQGKFDLFFRTVANPEADANRKNIRNDLDQFFSTKGSALYESASASTEAERSKITHLKADILAMSYIGLNPNRPAVRRWLNALDDRAAIPSMDSLIGDIVLRQKDIGKVREDAVAANTRLKAAISEVGSATDIGPITDAITARLNDLKKIKVLRQRVAARTK